MRQFCKNCRCHLFDESNRQKDQLADCDEYHTIHLHAINVHNYCPRAIGYSWLVTNNVSCENYWASSQNEMSRCSCRSALSPLQDLNRWPWSVGPIYWTRCTRLYSRPMGTSLGCHFPYSFLRNAMTLTTFRAVRQKRLCIIWVKFYFFIFLSQPHLFNRKFVDFTFVLGIVQRSCIRITCSQSLWMRI